MNYGNRFDECDGAGDVVDVEESLIGVVEGHQSVGDPGIVVQIDVIGGDLHHELIDGHVPRYRRFVRNLNQIQSIQFIISITIISLKTCQIE